MSKKNRTVFPAVWVFLLAAAALTGCADPDILIVRDQYWKALEFGSDSEEHMLQISEESGVRVAYADIEFPSDTESINGEILHSDPKVVVLSPLFSRHAGELAAMDTARRVVAFGIGSGDLSLQENLTVMVSDRENAYLQAGMLCRYYLDSAGSENKSIGALFYSGGSERASERQSFVKGVGGEDADHVFIRSFPRQDSINEVNSFLSSLNEESAGIIFVSMAGLNHEAITSILTKSQAFIISEQIESRDGPYPYEGRVIASIEQNWVNFFSFDLSSYGPEILVEASLEPGPAVSGPSVSWARTFFQDAGGVK